MPTLSITYTPNYEGCHNIGFRLLDSVSDYCIVKDNSLSIIGTPKTTEIDLTEDLLACLTITEYKCISTIEIEGYVQACCSGEGEDLIPFTITAASFGCKTYEVGCTGSPMQVITVTNGGSGYTIVPLVSITGGVGSGASATAQILGGQVIAINIDPGVCGDGYNYSNLPTVTVAPPDTPGTTATAAVTLLRGCQDGCGGDDSIRVTGCYDGVPNRVSSPAPGKSYKLCALTTPNISFIGPYATVQELDSTACCSCKYYNLENLDDRLVEYFYIDCNGIYRNQINLAGLANVNICAIEDSIHTDNYTRIQITLLGNTCP